MNHDDESITTTSAPSASATDEIVTTANGDDHDLIGSVVPPTNTDGEKPSNHDNDVLVDADGNRAIAIAPSPGPEKRRRARASDDEMILRRAQEIADIERRRKRRNKSDAERLRDLKGKNRKEIAARDKEMMELFEKQESAARYRLADALLKALAKVPQPNWPTLVTTVVGEVSAEDRAALRRILQKIADKGSAE